MIKLKICTSSTTTKNVLVDFDQHQQQTIGKFIERAVDICSLSGNSAEYELFYQQFNLPNKLSSGHLNASNTYSLIRKRSKKEKIEQKRKIKSGDDVHINKDKNSVSEQSESESISESSGLQEIPNSKNKNSMKKQQIKKGQQKKNEVFSRKQKQEIKSIKRYRNSGKSSSEVTQKEPLRKQKPISLDQPKKQISNKNIGLTARTQSTRLKQEATYLLKGQESKRKAKVPSSSEESSESSLEKNINPIKKALAKPPKKHVIEDSSSLESSQQKREHQSYHKKINQVLQKVTERTGNQNKKTTNANKDIQIYQVRNENTFNSHASNNSHANNERNSQTNSQGNSNQTRLAVPLSVRKKIIDSSLKQKQKKSNQRGNNPSKQPQKQKSVQTFKQYQQLKWVAITKELIGKWNQQHTNKPYLYVGNQIRFKIVDIDLQKFVPVTSGWITGFVIKIEGYGQGTTISFDQVVKADRQNERTTQKILNYSLAVFNMQQIQINKHTLTADQSILKNENSDRVIQSKVETKEPQKGDNISQQIQVKEEKATKSLEDFIRGQINYYFSDKNYLTDLYLRMQANTHPEKFINVDHFQNFPKIKKVLKDKSKLWEYLSTDEKISQRNYELDMANKMIRKRV